AWHRCASLAPATQSVRAHRGRDCSQRLRFRTALRTTTEGRHADGAYADRKKSKPGGALARKDGRRPTALDPPDRREAPRPYARPVAPRLGAPTRKNEGTMHATQFSDRTEVRISRFDRNATAAVLAMVGRCSPETTYRRFHGVVDAVAQVTAQLAGDRHESFVATVEGRCVGLATLATEGASAHIGVLVEDAYQRCGVGAALACAVVA